MSERCRIAAGEIEAGKVYQIQFECDTPGPEIEKGDFDGLWTGEADTWGKLTFEDVRGGPDRYLFPREIKQATPTIVVGMGATLCYPSDRYPYTIIAVGKSGKTLTLQADDPGKNREVWPAQDYDPQPNPDGSIITARLGRYGWKANGVGVLVGIRRFYQAPEL